MCQTGTVGRANNVPDWYLDRVKRIWYLSPMRAAKVQASLRIRAVSPEPLLLAHTSSESRGTFRQKARSLAPLNGWACAVKICHDGMLEDTNSLDGAHFPVYQYSKASFTKPRKPCHLRDLNCNMYVLNLSVDNASVRAYDSREYNKEELKMKLGFQN